MKLMEILSGGFTYKGYTVMFDQDSEGFYWINYKPELPKELDLQYNKAINKVSGAELAKEAIDKLHLAANKWRGYELEQK